MAVQRQTLNCVRVTPHCAADLDYVFQHIAEFSRIT